MHSVIAWILICILMFIASVALALLAIVRKKLKLFIAATVLFFVFIGCGVYALVKMGIKVMGIANTTFALEDGVHIYERTWGKPATNCMQILDYRDATIPVLNFYVELQFKTCPQEVARILKGKSYALTMQPAQSVRQLAAINGNNAFNGASTVMHLSAEAAHGREDFYISIDSTEVYYRNSR